ncbi:GNAT family N-acetyltransferase [Halobacillus karajensis]|uniref:Acetyltransferase n=1 Tax=Halobacillus karajensis TaxID=195088 RepID=A0A024P861_9BACI|nr:GNAT family N-acetyltransferase [Halobacillus karajensis]CDQ20058.1 putative acetyltransferase [Halobacillus karajensis]CDQ25279.1 putative acetyltransferase [Halobacillus karajensis]CDQ28360.1 putative acetyltransferase [Halobacillus karajensis]
MVINFAKTTDGRIIHDLMIKAFMEYNHEIPPSSALKETAQSVSDALEEGEEGLIAYEGNKPVGMVRFQIKNKILYFYRLSVIPNERGKGIAKKILTFIEKYANKEGLSSIRCKVRMSEPKNIKLYRSIGYDVYRGEVVDKPNGINTKVVTMRKDL